MECNENLILEALKSENLYNLASIEKQLNRDLDILNSKTQFCYNPELRATDLEVYMPGNIHAMDIPFVAVR